MEYCEEFHHRIVHHRDASSVYFCRKKLGFVFETIKSYGCPATSKLLAYSYFQLLSRQDGAGCSSLRTELGPTHLMALVPTTLLFSGNKASPFFLAITIKNLGHTPSTQSGCFLVLSSAAPHSSILTTSNPAATNKVK